MRSCFSVIILFFSLTGKSQLQITTKDGLPHNNVTCVLQDREGFIWIGTANGLARFDGTHFYRFSQGSLESDQLAGDLILDLEEEEDVIWVGHRFGLTKISKRDLKCRNYQVADTGIRYGLNRAIREIYRDTNGDIWLGGIGLSRFDRKKDSILTIATLGKWSSFRNAQYIHKIVPDKSAGFYLLTGRGFIRYSRETTSIDTSFVEVLPVDLFLGSNIRLIAYWNTFASQFSISRIGRDSVGIYYVRTPAGAIKQVRNFYVDSNRTLFISTEKKQTQVWKRGEPEPGIGQPTEGFNTAGMLRGWPYWGNTSGLHLEIQKESDRDLYSLSDWVQQKMNRTVGIRSLTQHDNSQWLVGTTSGIFWLDRGTGQLREMQGWTDSTIHYIWVEPDKTTWISTEDYLYHYDPGQQKVLKQFRLNSYAIGIQPVGDSLLIATRAHGLVFVDRAGNFSRLRYQSNPGILASDRITSIGATQSNGDILVTYNEPMATWSVNNFSNNYHRFFKIPTDASVFGEQFSISHALQAPGQLWLGCYIGGAYLYDSSDGKWTNFTSQNGLSNNYVSGFIRDHNGRTWIISNEGVDIFQPGLSHLVHFPWQMSSVGTRGGFLSKDGYVVMHDGNSILEINPLKLPVSTEPSQVVFSQVMQQDQLIQLDGNRIRLPYHRNSISIIFSLLKLDPQQLTRYSYRMSEKDPWQDLGTETKLSFASLEPGKYSLQVRAMDEFGQWSHFSKTLQIQIKPPFHRTLFFWFLMTLAVLFLVRQVYNYRLRQLKKLYELRQKISRDFHDELGATLSGIKVFSELARDRPEGSAGYLDKINNYSEEMLDKMSDIVWTINPENDSFDKIITKLQNDAASVAAARNIRLHFIIDESIRRKTLDMNLRKNLYLIIKEAINNAVKYAEGRQIIVSLSQRNKQGVLKITDDGKGFDLSGINEGNGLSNMKQRAEEIGGEFTIQTAPGKGTSLELVYDTV